MKNSLLFLFLIIGLIGTSCRKNDDIITGGPDPVIFVQTQVMGVIKDAQGQGLEGVNIRWGQQSATTDENGFFTFPSAAADEQGTVLQITANGYFDLTKTVVPIPNGRTWLEAMLTSKTLSGTVQASAGGTVTINGAAITLPAGGIVGSGNVPYTGTVNVYATWLDPTSSTTLDRMPGNLSAITADDQSGSLATYGMIGVELETPSGAPLQIAQGAEAQIRMNIPNAILADAPATISLWHFDVVKGKWIEEGVAEKVGNEYVGTVSHFSFWNCDIFFENVSLSGRVVDSNGTPLIGVQVKATLVNGNPNIPASANAWTNSDGEFGGKVPANEVILIEILDQCGDVIFSQQVGPLSADLDLGDITVDLAGNLIAITGSLVDCDGNPVINGYVRVAVAGFTVILPTATDGTVSAVVSTCDADELIAIGFDIENLKSSPVQTYTITGLSDLDLGELVACDVFEEYISCTLGGSTNIILNTEGGIQGGSLFINGGDSLDVGFYFILDNVTTPGTYYPETVEAIVIDGVNGNYIYGWCQGLECQSVQVTLTSIGAIGDPIIGTFSGTLTGGNTTQGSQSISGSFKVIRDY
ncbi:MAG: carboxypeptidase-like regulatory domain-containing protein [Saprospiraceae bacterium]